MISKYKVSTPKIIINTSTNFAELMDRLKHLFFYITVTHTFISNSNERIMNNNIITSMSCKLLLLQLKSKQDNDEQMKSYEAVIYLPQFLF